MAGSFRVQTSPHFERLVKKLQPRHSELVSVLKEAVKILEDDPYNQSKQYAIKKLVGKQPDGQWRLRLGRWRFRYDISGQVVELKYCGLRREDTYR